VKVCDIGHGGKSPGKYTLTRYATDIGMKPKTLIEWVSVYKNVIKKLGIKEGKITPLDWSTANKTHNEMSKNKDGKRGYKKLVARKSVRSLFDGIKETPYANIIVTDWIKRISGMTRSMENHDFSELSPDLGKRLTDILKEAADASVKITRKTTLKRKPQNREFRNFVQ
jgi:hypothetical protein